MNPEVISWWNRARRSRSGEECRASACGPSARSARSWQPTESRQTAGGEGGAFGVRRPLRFLSQKLELDEKQVAKLAKILDELKTERAQAAVDGRRTTSALADALDAETFDLEKASKATEARVESARRLKSAVLEALSRMHELLDAEQRETLAYLLRTGVLSM